MPPAGDTAWETVDDGIDAGPQSYHEISNAGDEDQFRVVARDGHGNTAVNPVRTVSVP